MRKRELGALMAAVAVSAVTSVSALAAPAAAAEPTARLELTITPENGENQRSVVLECGPAGGSHPRAADACATLARADGDFGQVRAHSGACTMEFDPGVLRATGHWNGTPVDYRKDFTNPCVAGNETGGVFAF
ncbi:SSI family serine proteinase inhibitor [Marinactinospora rubrisoli]|uniref:SSI family serine proteinase inhibitor n=1 Tax=Marinactinospora rubrisoli TaxID=2715399 RepID=A0ABW2KDC2_9ACTN